jgi:PAS domain S-box-containing protein
VSITDLNNIILYVNDTFLRMYGYEEKELLGKSIEMVKHTGEASQESSLIVKNTMEGGWQGELMNRRKDGTTFPITLSTSVVRDEEGNAVGFIGVARDISRREEREKQLRQLSRAVEQSPASIIITDATGTIEYVNRKFTQVTGYTSEEVTGKNPRILKSGMTSIQTYRDLWTTIASGAEWQGELQNRKKNGELYWEFASISPVYDNDRKITHYLAVKEDITAQKHMELQLRQAQKMESMGVLVGGISHDFNNILNNVLGFVHQLRKNTHDQAKVAKYADTIEKSALRGAELANQLLSFVRHNKQELEPVNIATLIDEVSSLLHETLPRNIALERTMDAKPMVVSGVRGELYQVLLNLCLNARDAMPDGGRLHIETRSAVVGPEFDNAVVASPFSPGQPCVQICVTDTGTGIPEHIRDKIFDPLFTTKDRGRGTGLGLSVVYNIVKNHKGTIVVKSEEGKGSSFTVYLPAVNAQTAEEGPAEEQHASSRRSNKLVLLVDDEAPMVELGKELLEDEGFDVLTAKDGLEALEIYRRRWQEIGLVVLDLVMPGMDGGQAYLEMKKVNPDIKAFFCTGYSSDRVITSLLEEEHLEALQKPFRPREFTRMVREKMEE